MMGYSVKSDVRQVERMLSNLQKKNTPYATSLAINRTAQKVKDAEVKEMERALDRPTKFTLNGLMIKPSNKRDLTARVWLKDWTPKGTAAERYLMPNIAGGPRQDKRFERVLRRSRVLPGGYYVVPGAAAEIDSHGNMRHSQIVQILSYLKAFPESGYKANITAKKKAAMARGSKNKFGHAYFVAHPGSHLPPGVYRRTHFSAGSAIRPVMLFVQAPQYRKRLDFFGVAERTANKHFADEFRKAMAQAIATDDGR